MKIENMSIIISGASSGIGQAVAIELSKSANRLWLIGRNEKALKDVTQQCQKNGSECEWQSINIQDPFAVKNSFQQFQEKFGFCDLLFLSAGVADLTYVENMELSSSVEMMQTNYFGVLHWILIAVPEMIKRRCGTIAVVSALAGYRGLPQGAFYGASKAALNNSLESFRVDLKKYNIQVTTVLPAFVDTPMARKFDYAMPNVWSAKKAARYIVAQLEKRKAEIAFPWALQFLMKCIRFLPVFIFDPLFTKISVDAYKKGNTLRKT